MGLMNIFRKNNSDKIIPLNTSEKIFLVKVFSKSHNIIPKDFGDTDVDDLTSLVSTQQYTLVMYLDYLYMFTVNNTIRRRLTKKAAKSGIDLQGFSLNTNSLLKFAEYYTTMRKLPEFARKEIYEMWQNSVNSSDEDSFDTFKAASYWWGVILLNLFRYLTVWKKGSGEYNRR